MSYDSMDHAQWVERQIASLTHFTAADKKRAAMGIGWAAAPREMNAFQRRAMTILGIIGRGIYNAPINWETVQWRRNYLCVTWTHEMSTIDGDALTDAVMLAHAAAIRISIQSAGRYLRILLHERKPRSPDTFWHSDHPTPEQVIERFEKRFPAGHAVHWRAEENAQSATSEVAQ